MDTHEHFRNGDSKQPESSKATAKFPLKDLQLPLSCHPPGPTNPAKRLVWIVSLQFLPSSLKLQSYIQVNLHLGLWSNRSHGPLPRQKRPLPK